MDRRGHDWRHDAIESALAHAPGDQVRAAYNRASYSAERSALMQSWADQLDAWRKGRTVTRIKRSGDRKAA